MVIVDSSVWIDYVRAHENEYTFWLKQRIGQSEIGLTDMILLEVLQGTRNDKTFQQVQNQLTQFSIFNTGGQELAVKAAENYRFLRKRGHTIRKQIDCLIATFCIVAGFPLLHQDGDFEPFEEHLGLQVVRPVRH